MEAPLLPVDTDAGMSMGASADDVAQESVGRMLTPQHASLPPMPAQRQEGQQSQQSQPAQWQEEQQLLHPKDKAPHMDGKGEPRKKRGLCSELTSEGSCWSKLVNDDAPPSCVIA